MVLDDGCIIKRFPDDDGGSIEKTLVRVSLPPFEEFYAPTFHPDSSQNQIRSVVGRVLGPVPKPSKAGIASLMKTINRWGTKLPPTRQAGLEEMPMRYSGAKKQRYLNALDAICTSGASDKDAYCTGFVKAERFDGFEKRDPDPRMIQFRGAKFCVEFASYLQPIEHILYLTDFCSSGVPKSRNIAKGLNQTERAELLLQKRAAFVDPVVVSIDASRFDKHVSQELLTVEHALYKRCNNSNRFAKLCARQLLNKVFTKRGMRYVARGRRMSGDMNTALGNCVLMIAMVVTYFEKIGVTKYDALDDGDDCLLIIERCDLELVRSTLCREFLEFGMEMKVEEVATSMEAVVFCRSRPVEFAPGRWKFVRNYRDVVSKALTGIRNWSDRKYRERVIKAVGMCELSLNSGVPVLQAFSLALLRNTKSVKFDYKYLSDGMRVRYDREARSHPIEALPITDRARESFEAGFGVSVSEQLELEEYFKTWNLCNDGLFYWGREWDVDWIPDQSFIERGRRQNAETRP